MLLLEQISVRKGDQMIIRPKLGHFGWNQQTQSFATMQQLSATYPYLQIQAAINSYSLRLRSPESATCQTYHVCCTHLPSCFVKRVFSPALLMGKVPQRILQAVLDLQIDLLLFKSLTRTKVSFRSRVSAIRSIKRNRKVEVRVSCAGSNCP